MQDARLARVADGGNGIRTDPHTETRVRARCRQKCIGSGLGLLATGCGRAGSPAWLPAGVQSAQIRAPRSACARARLRARLMDPQKARQDPAVTGRPLALTVFPVPDSRSGANDAVTGIAAVVNGLVWELGAGK